MSKIDAEQFRGGFGRRPPAVPPQVACAHTFVFPLEDIVVSNLHVAGNTDLFDSYRVPASGLGTQDARLMQLMSRNPSVKTLD